MWNNVKSYTFKKNKHIKHNIFLDRFPRTNLLNDPLYKHTHTRLKKSVCVCVILTIIVSSNVVEFFTFSYVVCATFKSCCNVIYIFKKKSSSPTQVSRLIVVGIVGLKYVIWDCWREKDGKRIQYCCRHTFKIYYILKFQKMHKNMYAFHRCTVKKIIILFVNNLLVLLFIRA